MFNHKNYVNNDFCKGGDMERVSNWEDEEVKTLFKFIEIKKSEGMALVTIFDKYANCTKRQKNSVRNYYYKELNNLKNDKDRVQKLNIDLSKHIVSKGVPFSKEEEEKTIKEINKLIDSGCSIRKACLTLSNGNVPVMLRLQNKYRALSQKKENKSSMGQIIKMPTRSEKLSEEDIKALFMGLVKLVKKQEAENIKSMYENELYKANEKLNKAIVEIANKQSKIEKLKSEIEIVKNELNQKGEILQRISNVSKNRAKDTIKEFFENKIPKNRVVKNN